MLAIYSTFLLDHNVSKDLHFMTIVRGICFGVQFLLSSHYGLVRPMVCGFYLMFVYTNVIERAWSKTIIKWAKICWALLLRLVRKCVGSLLMPCHQSHCEMKRKEMIFKARYSFSPVVYLYSHSHTIHRVLVECHNKILYARSTHELIFRQMIIVIRYYVYARVLNTTWAKYDW